MALLSATVSIGTTSAVTFPADKTFRILKPTNVSLSSPASTVAAAGRRVRAATSGISSSSTISANAIFRKSTPIPISVSTNITVTPRRVRGTTIAAVLSSATIKTPAALGVTVTLNKDILRTVSILASSSAFVSGFAESRGQASAFIRASSSLSFGAAGSQDYNINATDYYLQRQFPNLTWMQHQASNVTSVNFEHISIQATSSVSVRSSSEAILGVSINQKTNVRVLPTHIKGSETVDKNTGSKQASIILSGTIRGETTAQIIGGLRWSNFKGLGVGFKIVAGDYPYESVAVFLEDPQFKADTVLVNITVPFNDNVLPPGKWRFDVPEGTNFNEEGYTPGYFRQSDLLAAIMKDMRKHVVEPSQYLSERMRDFRKWDRIDAEFLGPLGSTMGLTIRMDRFDDEARRRAIHEWIQFCEYAGTESFMGFEGYVLDTIFTLEHLWTNNYKNFVPIELVTDSSYYPTNHVSLRYDANIFDIFNPEDIKYIYDLFYKLASVPLVLESLYAYTHDNSTVWVQGVGYEQEFAPWETNDFPPNLWVVGVDSDVRYADYEANELPPNFWIVPVDQDIEYVTDLVDTLDPLIRLTYWQNDLAFTNPEIDILNQGLTVILDPEP